MHFDLDPEQQFVIYRPPVTSGRLEPIYKAPTPNEWRPSVSYKHSLADIRNQYTPSEFFRHRLETVGKEIRLLQKLETRWHRRFEEFTLASIKVQALFRGTRGRAYFQSIKLELEKDLKRRRSYCFARESFLAGDFAESLQYCVEADEHPEPLQIIQMKAQYRLGHFSDCAFTAEQIFSECFPADSLLIALTN
jgi:hypothetical protein